jgi:hypothetical protein
MRNGALVLGVVEKVWRFGNLEAYTSTGCMRHIRSPLAVFGKLWMFFETRLRRLFATARVEKKHPERQKAP